jgi:hypothetical protein
MTNYINITRLGIAEIRTRINPNSFNPNWVIVYDNGMIETLSGEEFLKFGFTDEQIVGINGGFTGNGFPVNHTDDRLKLIVAGQLACVPNPRMQGPTALIDGVPYESTTVLVDLGFHIALAEIADKVKDALKEIGTEVPIYEVSILRSAGKIVELHRSTSSDAEIPSSNSAQNHFPTYVLQLRIGQSTKK